MTEAPGPLATRTDVARLLGRVAFGATAADLDRWTGRPYADLVDSLLAVPALALPTHVDLAATTLGAASTGALSGSDAVQADVGRRQWLERMRSSPQPLLERMTLLWHDHFATAIRPELPDAGLLLTQVETLRRYALADVRSLLAAMTLDPAMLLWLDGAHSAPPHPNENFARELLELFVLGRSPQVYSERDVREAARALTGWTVQPQSRLVRFEPARHDTGRKHVLGRVLDDLGAAEHEALLDVALAQPVAPLHVAAALVRGLAYVPDSTDLLRRPDPLVSRVARALRASDWQLQPALRTLLLSPEFRTTGQGGLRRHVRSPVEAVVATCRALGLSGDDAAWLPLLRRMGQVLLAPPNVGGWPAGTDWLSPPAVIARYDLGLTAAERVQAQQGALGTLPAADDLAAWTARFGLAGLSRSTARAVRASLASAGADEPQRRAGVLALLVSSPDWTVV